MIAKVSTIIPFGYDGRLVEVEGDQSNGLPNFEIVGMATKTVFEARERVRSAIKSSQLSFPDRHLTINLAPAELTKEGAYMDLPIALCTLILSGQIMQSDMNGRIFVGELSLTGELRPVRGIINIIEYGKENGYAEFFVPYQNLAQAKLVPGVTVYGVKSLNELIMYLCSQQDLPTTFDVTKTKSTSNSPILLDSIRGQDFAKRAVIAAVAGHHNILISGPPGAGKTLLARAATSLMPDLSPEETIEVTKLHSLSGESEGVVTSRPFRTPHHSCTLPALIGGGSKIIPGEISLAHLGVLFLDEMPEYPRSILESLRQPLEDNKICLTRAKDRCTYPCNFMLFATMNPCPCGFFGDKTKKCTCTSYEIQQYHRKISGPLLDRIDLKITVNRVKNEELMSNKIIDLTSAIKHQNVVKNNITDALDIQHARYHSNTKFNSNLTSSEIIDYIKLTNKAQELLKDASEKLELSARSYFKIIKVSRTIADLAKAPGILPEHIMEALSYRMDII